MKIAAHPPKTASPLSTRSLEPCLLGLGAIVQPVRAKTLQTRIAAALSTATEADEAAVGAAREAAAELAGERPDLAFLFFSPQHLERAAEAAEAVREELRPRHLLGCVSEGVLGGGREVEEGPAVALWAGVLPEGEIECFHAEAHRTEEGVAVEGFPDTDDPALVTLLIDPYSFPAQSLLDRLNAERPGLPLVGGIATGAGGSGAQALILDEEVFDRGAAGAVLSGVRVTTVVSQGCAPIGHEAVITSAEGNIVLELAGQPALERLRRELARLPRERQLLAAQGLLTGLVIDENQPEYERGDFLIRGLLGADEETGALLLGEQVRVGQTLRFHVRDAASADEDLREALAGLGEPRAAGALLFTCNGRGTRMFPAPDHDARVVSEALGSPALAGFFCGGEIGPVGGRAFLHGFTATLAVFFESHPAR